MLYRSHFRNEYVIMHKRGHTRMLLVSLLGDNRLETRGSWYWTACFRNQNGRQRRISTKETNNKKALKLARYGSSALSGVEHLTLLVAEVRVCRSRELETQAKPTRTVLNLTPWILPLSALVDQDRTLTSSYSVSIGYLSGPFCCPVKRPAKS